MHEFSGERKISENLTTTPAMPNDKMAGRTSVSAEVFPRARQWELIVACQQLTDNQAREALQSRLLPFVFMPGQIFYAAAGEHAIETARQSGKKVVARASPSDMLFALQEVFGEQVLYNSRFHLANDAPVYSASTRVTRVQAGFMLLLTAIVAVGLWRVPETTFMILASLFAITFFCVVGLRLASLLPVEERKSPPSRPLQDSQLPVYTVLVPLFRERSVLHQLIRGLVAINYPPSKLDIKLVLEEADVEMVNAVNELSLPPQFEIIIVPDAKPQTKPKALNYALHFARGELVVVFDAEDIPEPDQLRLAAETFAAGPSSLVCLQARLTFYNANENWLTRQFTIEYAVLFDLVLPLLASMDMPLPLGGTSNHFRMQALRKLGAWDPYNVTEDADLGIRLARFGWRAAVIDSSTFEEANNAFGNWMAQRARWLKGWIQTWFVHMRNPRLLWQQLGTVDFMIVQIIMAGIVVSTLVHPFFLAAIIWSVASGSLMPLNPNLSGILLVGIGLAVFIAGYVVTLGAGYVALRLRGLQKLYLSILAMPFYWILISLGGWLAVKQFVTHPFHWNKTTHGLSKVSRRRN